MGSGSGLVVVLAREGEQNVLLSREARCVYSLALMTGERPEMSKERRYESNDSREMLNCSPSLTRFRKLLLVVLREELVWPQKDLFSSMGEGGKQMPLSLISVCTVSLRVESKIDVNLPLNLYSVASFSPESIDRPVKLLLRSGATLTADGRMFSSCFLKGLRTKGMVRCIMLYSLSMLQN